MPNGRNYGGGHRSSIDLRDSLHYSLACVPKRRADSFFYYSSKIRKTLFDQGGEGRSEHTKGFCPPVCRALRCPSMEPGHRFAPRLRRADYSTLLGVVNLLVCSPACLPAARLVLLRARFERGWLALRFRGRVHHSVSIAPLTCVSGAWRSQLRRESLHAEQLTQAPGNAAGCSVCPTPVDSLSTCV